VCISCGTTRLPVRRLYWRKRSWKRYRPLLNCKNDESFDSPVTCDFPVLFFLATTMFECDGVVGSGAVRIGVADLANDGAVRFVIPNRSNPDAVSVTNLVGASPDGRELYCVAGLLKGLPGTHARQMVFSICRLNVRSMVLRPITGLKTAWC
jgi:hypothetical protein